MKVTSGLASFAKFSFDSFKQLKKEHESSSAQGALDKITAYADEKDRFEPSSLKQRVEALKEKLGMPADADPSRAEDKAHRRLNQSLADTGRAFANAVSSYTQQKAAGTEEKQSFKMSLRMSLMGDTPEAKALWIVFSAKKIDAALEEGYEKYQQLHADNMDLPPEAQISNEDIMTIVKMTVMAVLMGMEEEIDEEEAKKNAKKLAGGGSTLMELYNQNLDGLSQIIDSNELQVDVVDSQITVTALDNKDKPSVTVDIDVDFFKAIKAS